MYNIWNLGICCSPEETTSELKFGIVHDEGIAGSGLQGRSGQAFDYLPCAGDCVQQGMDTNEVVVMPITTPVSVRNTAPRFTDQAESMQGAYSSSPLPASGPQPETITAQWPELQESPLDPRPLPPPVPQIIGLANLSSVCEEDQKREEGAVVVDLIRDGPQWSNLGVLVSQNAENNDNLNIDHIDELSLLGNWNAKLPKARQVWEGDVIIAVNGCTGRELIRQIPESSEKGCRVTLHVARRQGGRPAG